jgi:hypothetical protein
LQEADHRAPALEPERNKMNQRGGGLPPPALTAGPPLGKPTLSSNPSKMVVGEVGRVLLSSTMLGYDSAVQGARKHVLQQLAVPVEAPKPGTVVQQQQLGEATEQAKKKRNKKRNKKKANGPAGSPGNESADAAVIRKLQEEIRTETERLITLAGSQEAILQSELERLRSENKMLSLGSWRDLLPTENSPGVQSGYDSDSTSTTTTTTANEANEALQSQGKPPITAATRYLQGRAQEKVLSQAREAISRAANLCQFLADPKQPGSLERRDVLIRAFRAITIDHNTRLEDVDESKPLL